MHSYAQNFLSASLSGIFSSFGTVCSPKSTNVNLLYCSSLATFMFPQLIALFITLVVLLLIVYLFLPTMISLAVNVAILYVVGVRTAAEIQKYPARFKEYGIGALVGLILVWLLIGQWLLWSATWVLVIAFAIGKIILLAKKK